MLDVINNAVSVSDLLERVKSKLPAETFRSSRCRWLGYGWLQNKVSNAFESSFIKFAQDGFVSQPYTTLKTFLLDTTVRHYSGYHEWVRLKDAPIGGARPAFRKRVAALALKYGDFEEGLAVYQSYKGSGFGLKVVRVLEKKVRTTEEMWLTAVLAKRRLPDVWRRMVKKLSSRM